MSLLIITQKIDKQDPVLGFFHEWVKALAQKTDKATVICLQKGESALPAEIKVLSLGKERGNSRVGYLYLFFKYLWQERKNYQTVFVHMNQEYILLAGWWWRLTGKKVYLWRNHHAGNWLTDIAVFFCNQVFCTSKYSYTAKFSKTKLMPVGIDTDLFKPVPGAKGQPGSILFLGRISPVKKPHLLLAALQDLKNDGEVFTAHFYGNALPKDDDYLMGLKQKVHTGGLEQQAFFLPGVPNYETPAIYSAHEIFVNLSPSGMYDKTIFEAMACETLSLSSNLNLKGILNERYLFTEGDQYDLKEKLNYLLNLPGKEKMEEGKKLRQFVIAHHSLRELSEKLSFYFN